MHIISRKRPRKLSEKRSEGRWFPTRFRASPPILWFAYLNFRPGTLSGTANRPRDFHRFDAICGREICLGGEAMLMIRFVAVVGNRSYPSHFYEKQNLAECLGHSVSGDYADAIAASLRG